MSAAEKLREVLEQIEHNGCMEDAHIARQALEDATTQEEAPAQEWECSCGASGKLPLSDEETIHYKRGHRISMKPAAPREAKRWRVVCRSCGASEEGSEGEIPLRLHGRMENGQWQHYVANAFTAYEWCGPVVAEGGAEG